MYGRTIVQLGWLSSCVNYVYKHAIAPVVDAVTNLVSSMLEVLINDVFLPLLELQCGLQIEFVKAVLANIIYNYLYKLSRTLLWCLDSVENTFRVFAGLDPVYVQGADGVQRESGSLLLALFKNSTVQGALMGMIAIGFVLCFLIAVLSAAKAMGDMGIDGEKSMTAGKVMQMTFKAVIKMLLIPVMSLFFILLGNAVLKSIDLATGYDQVHISDVIFTMSTLDAVRDDYDDADFYNASTRSAALATASQDVIDSVSDYGLTDKYRNSYYRGDTQQSVDSKYIHVGYQKKKRDLLHEVLETFDIRRIDYIVTIGGSILFIYVMGMLALSMISRAFDVILLLLVEPFFAAMMPLDEGEKFNQWQEVFFGKLISGYGLVVAMNLYLRICTLLYSNKIAFFGEGTTESVIFLVNLLFVLIGAYSIMKAGPLITSIMSSEAGSNEAESLDSGAQLVRASMSFVTYPVRKLSAYAFGVASDKLYTTLYEELSGIKLDPKKSGVGQGDKFGNPIGTNASKTWIPDSTKDDKTSFKGYKSEDGSQILDTGTMPDTEGSAFDGKRVAYDVKNNAYDFLDAGNTGITKANDYVFIGQEDEKERQKKKEMEDLLEEEIDMDSLLAAESETGLDLNGDGDISGMANSAPNSDNLTGDKK